jgi:hypothetical protein
VAVKQPSVAQAVQILNSGGDTSKFNAATWSALKRIESTNQATAAGIPVISGNPMMSGSAIVAAIQKAQGAGGTGGAGSGGGGGTTQPVTPAYDRAPARNLLMQIFQQYGMEDLASVIDSFIVESGANDAYSLTERVRGSNQYKDRFKGLLDLRAKGITDVGNEGEYLRLESDYRKIFRDAGLGSFIGTSGSREERNAIADLVGKYSLSVNEVGNRIQDAQRVIADTPQEVKDSLQRYYNVDPATLVSYVLDPTRTTDQVNRLANAAIIGGYGTRAGLNIDLGAATGAADLAQGQDISLEALQTDLASARELRDTTKRLAEIEGQDLTDTEAFQAQLRTSAETEQKVKKLQSSERGRFSGTSGFAKGALSRPAVF